MDVQGFLYGVEKEQRKLQHKEHAERHGQHSTTTLEALFQPNSGSRAATPQEDDADRTALAPPTNESPEDRTTVEGSDAESWGHQLSKPPQSFLRDSGSINSALVTSTKSPFLQWLSNVARLGEQQREQMELATLRYMEQMEKMRYVHT